MSAAEVAAIKARIAGSGVTTLAVYESVPANPTYPYVALYAGAGISTSDREADERIRREVAWQTTTVGVSPEQCRAALDRVNARLENWRPDVAGRTCSKVEHEDSQPMRPDASLPDRVVFYGTDRWSTVSDPT